MLLPFVLVALVLVSPSPASSLEVAPKRALFHALAPAESAVGGALTVSRSTRAHAEAGGAFAWLDQLAVVRPHHRDPRAPPSLQMFIAVSVVKGEVGLRAFGSF